MSPPPIRTVGMTMTYGSSRGVSDLDLQVDHGEVFGFLGPNGAGKTTTIRVLLDHLRPSAGTAEIFGLDCHHQSVEVHRRIGYVPGDLALYERLTARGQLDWLARLRGVDVTARRDELAERFELELDRPIKELSKGNRQKVGLVQAFMHDPDLLVLDEPTSGLDPLMQDEFQQLLRESVAGGRSVFLSSHSLDEVQHVADRVGIIREGVLATVSSVEDLQAKALRQLAIRFAEPVAPAVFAGLAGVGEVTVDDEGTRLRFSVTGPLDPIVKAAAAHQVVDLLSEPADLDEIFLAFYRGDE
ncbi:MAG TPA: ABC transporter ATP-binding protein [Acidimicrobiales bacterium]